MIEIYRRGIPVDACSTLIQAGKDLGGSKNLLHNHKNNNAEGFPKPVATIGPCVLYVFAELEAFYNSMLWRQADRNIGELKGGGAA